MDLTKLNTTQLLDIYNRVTKRNVSRFSDKRTGLNRTIMALKHASLRVDEKGELVPTVYKEIEDMSLKNLSKAPPNPEGKDIREQYTIPAGAHYKDGTPFGKKVEEPAAVQPTSRFTKKQIRDLSMDPMIERTGDDSKLSKGIASEIAEQFDHAIRYSLAREKLILRIRREEMTKSKIFKDDPKFFVDDWVGFLLERNVLRKLE